MMKINSRNLIKYQNAFSLVELMVGLTIAIIASIAIFQVFSVSESYKRTTTAGSDALQSGGFSAYKLNRIISMAGSGLGGVDEEYLWGCKLELRKNGDNGAVTVGTNSSPYRETPENYSCSFEKTLDFPIRLMPVLIRAGSDTANPASADCSPINPAPLDGPVSDTILIFAASHPGAWGMALEGSAVGTPGKLWVDTTVGINSTQSHTAGVAGDLRNDLLLAVSTKQGAENTCKLTKVIGPSPNATSKYIEGKMLEVSVPLSDSDFPAGSKVINIGPHRTDEDADPAARDPIFAAITVGSDGQSANNLLMLDLFKNRVESVADNIVAIKAIYGVAANPNDRNVDSWEKPSGDWSYDNLVKNSSNVRRLRAVRVALIARNSNQERPDSELGAVSQKKIEVFGDIADPYIYEPVSGTEAQNYRYQIFEFTVPLRSMVSRTDEIKVNNY